MLSEYDEREVIGILENAETKFHQLMAEYADQVFDRVVVPFCRDWGFTFHVGNGTFLFVDGAGKDVYEVIAFCEACVDDGKEYMTPVRDSLKADFEQVRKLILTQIGTFDNCIFAFMHDYNG